MKVYHAMGCMSLHTNGRMTWNIGLKSRAIVTILGVNVLVLVQEEPARFRLGHAMVENVYVS